MTLTRRKLLKQIGLSVVTVGIARSPLGRCWAAADPPLHLPRSTPEDQGVCSSGILDFINSVETGKLNLHSMMVLCHGHVVAEGWWAPYAPGRRHTLYSLSKSFTSTAVGIAVAEGHLQLGDKVVSFFPDDLPKDVSPHLAAMRISDLLMMGAGHAKESLLDSDFSPPEKDWVKAILAKPVEHLPGTHFTYNNGAPYLLSSILQKMTGQTLLEYLKPRLFDPLGIENPDWEVDPRGVNTGGWGLRVKTEDIAKLGQLYLQKGLWNGRQILPETWVDQATRAEIPTTLAANLTPASSLTSDWAQGYGFQFWRCRLGAFRGDGAFGQFCIVMPKEDAVIAITSETADMQAVLNAVWKNIAPALRGVGLGFGFDRATTQLHEKLQSLALPLPTGQKTSALIARVNEKTYTIAENSIGVSRVSLKFEDDACVFTMHDSAGEHQVTCGIGRWVEGETDLSAVPLKLIPTQGPTETKMRIAAGGVWTDENTFVMKWHFTETAHFELLICRFEKNNLRVEFLRSLSIMNPAVKDKRPVLLGKTE